MGSIPTPRTTTLNIMDISLSKLTVHVMSVTTEAEDFNYMRVVPPDIGVPLWYFADQDGWQLVYGKDRAQLEEVWEGVCHGQV